MIITVILITSIILIACEGQTAHIDSYDYSSLTFPNYSQENPVRYLEEDIMGPYDGWQNFGTEGEIQTMPVPMATYTYQMYSYFIRNDLGQLYGDITLPEYIDDLPDWISDLNTDGHRILWFSMGRNLPTDIELVGFETIQADDNDQTFLKAEYEVVIDEVTQLWIIYFMLENDTYSSFGIRVNELYESVESWTDSIIKTYRLKQTEL